MLLKYRKEKKFRAEQEVEVASVFLYIFHNVWNCDIIAFIKTGNRRMHMSQYHPEYNQDNQPPRRRRAAQPVDHQPFNAEDTAFDRGGAQPFDNDNASQQRYQQYHSARPENGRPEAAYQYRSNQNAYHQPVQPAYAELPQQRMPPAEPYSPQPQNVVVNVVNTNTNTNNNGFGAGGTDSHFDGTLSQQVGYLILGFLIIVCTAGICYPWAFCMQYRWKAKHTVINGHRLVFDGNSFQLFGKWLLWMLLCIVTLGIYAFWVGIALERWRVKHTHFAN